MGRIKDKIKPVLHLMPWGKLGGPALPITKAAIAGTSTSSTLATVLFANFSAAKQLQLIIEVGAHTRTGRRSNC